MITGDKYSLYLNEHVFPRVFAVFNLRVMKDIRGMEEYMIHATANDLKEAVPVLAGDARDLSTNFINKDSQGTAKIVQYNPNEVLIRTDFSQNGLLVLTDNFHRIWKAAVDNNNAKIYPAYYTFRMVEVPEGEHIIRFYLRDNSFYYSIILAVVTLIVMVMIQIIRKSNIKHKVGINETR
jgi:hypothetical protein